jgi:quinol monooxygenase YgiN
MITEFGEMEIKPGLEQEFIDGVVKCMPMLLGSRGCQAVKLFRSQEAPSRFLLDVKWEDLEAHAAFKVSPGIEQWRAAVAHCLVARANVWHGDLVVGN